MKEWKLAKKLKDNEITSKDNENTKPKKLKDNENTKPKKLKDNENTNYKFWQQEQQKVMEMEIKILGKVLKYQCFLTALI